MAKTTNTVWETLSQVDVSEHVDEKGPEGRKLSYLSWAWAWATLMNHYPESTYEFREFARADGTLTDILQYPINDTASVHCTVTIDGVSRSMWLPVMDYRNQAIAAPDARAISDTKMRCLVKCIGLHGLGFALYAGEDLPDPKKDEGSQGKAKKPESKPEKKAAPKKDPPKKDPPKKANGSATEAIINVYQTFTEDCAQTAKLHEFWKKNVDELKKLEKSHPSEYAKVLAMFSAKKRELEQEDEGMDL